MNETSHVLQFSARLGANHGYLIDGDLAQLHADLEIGDSRPLAGAWALQLWACEAPHAGGRLSGVKVAEAGLPTSASETESPRHLDVTADAQVPGGQRDYAMVLVLASGEGGAYDRVHDFANYPARQRFITPHFEGGVGYQLESQEVVLNADSVRSPRNHANLSGSLTLELWAVAEPYRGGSVDGHLLARAPLGRLAGQGVLAGIAKRVRFAAPPVGRWNVVMMLREWAGVAGCVTRDYVTFSVPYLVSDVAAAAQPMTGSTTDEPPVVVRTEIDTPAAATSPAVARISVNAATVEELASVKGISKTLAKAIVNSRPYDSFESLLEVRGIGPKLLAKLRPHLKL